MPSTILGERAVTLPTDTTANRPTNTAGVLRHNTTTKTIEHGNGTSWIARGYPGSDKNNPASSAVEIFDAGIRGKGFFWLTASNGGVVRNFCDLDTLDQDGKAGWILVAQFGNSSQWRNGGNSIREPLDPHNRSLNENAQNDQWTRQWSANWGDYTINRFRILVSESVNSGGTGSRADWYYHFSTPCKWKEVWSWGSGANKNYINDASGTSDGNINASFHSGWPTPVNEDNATVSRACMRGFNWAYNIRWSYQVAQRWNNFADSSNGGTTQTNADFWTVLTTPTYNPGQMYGGNGVDDGSLAILPSTRAVATTAGQDMDTAVAAKYGYDDTGECAGYITSAGTGVVISSGGITNTRRCPMWMWIK